MRLLRIGACASSDKIKMAGQRGTLVAELALLGVMLTKYLCKGGEPRQVTLLPYILSSFARF